MLGCDCGRSGHRKKGARAQRSQALFYWDDLDYEVLRGRIAHHREACWIELAEGGDRYKPASHGGGMTARASMITSRVQICRNSDSYMVEILLKILGPAFFTSSEENSLHACSPSHPPGGESESAHLSVSQAIPGAHPSRSLIRQTHPSWDHRPGPYRPTGLSLVFFRPAFPVARGLACVSGPGHPGWCWSSRIGSQALAGP